MLLLTLVPTLKPKRVRSWNNDFEIASSVVSWNFSRFAVSITDLRPPIAKRLAFNYLF
jgi:outer membrane cobalamin receptor